MVFSSVIFLFIFLPFTLLVNFLLTKEIRNVFLLIASLIFYAWGEGPLVLLMIISIIINYIVGLGIEKWKDNKQSKSIVLTIGILINIGLLGYYKYFNFIIENLGYIFDFSKMDFDYINLPIGISFFTFQSISYLIDLYRNEVEVQKNPLHLGLYISLFPQLIAGPIVRYHDIANQIKNRSITLTQFTSGLNKFIRGLAKKVFVANTAALMADTILSNPIGEIPTVMAWLAILSYAIQIYFDFSGYSDMAIGLGRMFGFEFKENFNYPYIAKSIQDFWRRWHISLSTWFRDYLYIPLGGNRVTSFKVYRNLLIVFLVTGLWHGASWNFVFWGVYHGIFIMLERAGIINTSKFPKILQHIYLIIIVLIGWVFFRIENFNDSLHFVVKLFNFSSEGNWEPLVLLNTFNIFILLWGVIFATPIRLYFIEKLKVLDKKDLGLALNNLSYLLLFVLTLFELSQSSYNPFIYFRF